MRLLTQFFKFKSQFRLPRINTDIITDYFSYFLSRPIVEHPATITDFIQNYICHKTSLLTSTRILPSVGQNLSMLIGDTDLILNIGLNEKDFITDLTGRSIFININDPKLFEKIDKYLIKNKVYRIHPLISFCLSPVIISALLLTTLAASIVFVIGLFYLFITQMSNYVLGCMFKIKEAYNAYKGAQCDV